MNKFFYTILFAAVLFCIKDSKSQGFSFTPLESTFIQHPYIPDSIQVIKHRAIVRNTSSSAINFRFARIYNDLPSAWETQMCYDLCYAPFIDTISLTSDPPYSILPNHTDTLFYIDFSCTGQGLGTSIVKMFNTDNPSQFVQDTFKVQIGNVGISSVSFNADNYSLSQNYPNPFNPVTSIDFSIKNAGNVSLKIYDILGNEVASLINNQKLQTGKYKIDYNAAGISSGIYYYSLSAENFKATRKMILLK
jgi:5-hydroxyisourate hydrolase-like protein (transthyretin family)